MERLTELHHKKSDGYYMRCSEHCNNDICDCGCEKFEQIVDRLGAYEDTGLEPDDIKRAFNEEAVLKLAGNVLGVSPDRLRELAQADREGRCVVLPCKLHDKIYYVEKGRIRETAVDAIHHWTSGRWKLSTHTDRQYLHWIGYEIDFEGIGKVAFLTREEAEAALKEVEG